MITSSFVTGVSSVSLDIENLVYSEDDGSVEVCAVISGLPAGGLGTDVIVDFDVVGLSAGNEIVTV